MRDLYPLKFTPIAREMIWGGDKLRRLFNKPFSPGAKIGESWEISSVPDNISVVRNGFLRGNSLTELLEVYMGDLAGEKVFEQYGTEFPLLVKLIDANDDLSIQVHPDDELALRRHNGRGKTEMWYVLEATEGAGLISGFNRKVSRSMFLEKIHNGTLPELLNIEKVSSGDTFFMPAGRVHAIGRGIVLAEIQQSSDITYRIYDWDRVDDNGTPRQLHTDLALDAIDFSGTGSARNEVEVADNVPVSLVDCPYFTTNKISVRYRLRRDYSLLDSFVIYICTGGTFTFDNGQGPDLMTMGETVLLPAITGEVMIESKEGAELLEVFIKT